MTRNIRAVSEIREEFDAVLIDQFGVLHDGRTAFPRAQRCLRALAEARIPVVALSNSGKRSALNASRLQRLGFPEELFKAVVTSGELAYYQIADALSDGRMEPDTLVAVLSRDRDISMIRGLPVHHVGVDDAPGLLIIAATEPETCTLESYLDQLKPLARAGVPALCINPDRQIYSNGQAAFGPGMIAHEYAALGASVKMLGKPGREMFDAGLRALGYPPPERCLMIGDSPEHDIAGAKRAGCKALLISTGVQADLGAGELRADYRMDWLAW